MCDHCSETIEDGTFAKVVYPVYREDAKRFFGPVSFVHNICEPDFTNAWGSKPPAIHWYGEELNYWLPRVGFAVLDTVSRGKILDVLERLDPV